MASKEFLEEMWAQAKKLLPGWMYATLLQNARPASGGRASHRIDEPTHLEKLALTEIKPEKLKDVPDEELHAVWLRLQQWYVNAKKRKQAVENVVNAALWVKREIESRRQKVEDNALTEEIAHLAKAIEGEPEQVPTIAPTGPNHARFAFVVGALSPSDIARKELLTGAEGALFQREYLRPLGLTREDVLLLAAVPTVIDGEKKHREPPQEAIEKWQDWLEKEITSREPARVIALGKAADRALKNISHAVMPHPYAVLRFGNSGEVARKIKKFRTTKAIEEGETRGDASVNNWQENWQDMLPKSGKGEFTYQHHWRGLEEEEISDDEPALMKTDHSVHGDLRLEGDDALWGFTVFLGETKDNRNLKDQDKLIDWNPESKIQTVPKLNQPKEWLDVGKGKPYVSPPGEVGATSEKYSKFFRCDGGTYQLGVARLHMVEIFLDGEKLKGRYLLEFVPVAGQRRWLIEKPEDQTPYAESHELSDVLDELRKKGQTYLIWAKPGERPQKIDVKTGKVVKGNVSIIKADDIKKIVYGVVLDPYGNDGPKPDAQNDWNPPSEIEKTAHDYLKHSRVVGLQHQKQANANVVESWVEQYPSREDYLKAMHFEDHKVYRRPFGSDKVHSGSWILGVELGDKEWQDYKQGRLNAFSVGGYGVRRPIARNEMPTVTFIDLEEKKEK
jgi:uracil-DNA glycosylase